MSVKTSQLQDVVTLSSADLIQIIDVSDVLPFGMSASGTNKKITAGTLASNLLTIGGYAAGTHVHTAATATAPGFMSVADKTKLDGITTLSGSNTGDETASTIKTKLGITTLSGSNTGDETASTIKTALGITTLSGSNTGDQTITLTGDVTGNGTSSFATTLANSGVTAGEYNKSATTVTPFTVDSKGRVTSTGTAVTIKPDWSNITSKPTTLSGYGITDSAPVASPTFTGTVTLPAGTVSTSPLKLKTGVNLTTASFGSIEFDGTNLYLTNNSASPTRKTIAFTDSALTGNVSGSVANFTGSLAGDVAGTQGNTTISASTVTSKVLTGYVSGNGTIAATDTILQAINKLNGNNGLKANLANPTFTGNVTLAIAPTDNLHAATKAYVDTSVSNLVNSAPATLNTLNELALALGNDASFSTTVTNSIAAKAPLASPTFTGTVTLPAGNATVAPLKLATGVNLTTAAFGSVEFDGTNLYLTNNSASPTRKTIAFTDSALTGYVSGNGTITATDTVLQAINKLNGNDGLKANLANPTFTGNVTLGQAPTDNLHAATKAYVDGQVATVSGITVSQQTALDQKANLSGPTFTGAPKAPTASTTTNSTQIATTAYVQNVVQGIVTDGFDFNSPTFTGTPKAPTAQPGTNTEQIATTAYVKNAIDSINVGGGGAITSYTITSNVPTVAEGSTVTFTVLTNSQATTLYWTTDATDVSPVSGTINLNSGVGTFSVTASADGVAETNDNFIVYVRTGGPTGTVVANCLVNISDTAVVAPGTDTYIVTPNLNLITEGSEVTFTVVVNTAATILYWTAPAADFITSSGQFSVEGNVGIFTVRAKVDSITEGIESLKVEVRTGSVTGPVVATCDVGISDNPVNISMTPTSTTIKEGESVTFNVTATNTPGTTMYWTTDSNATTLKSDSVAILNNAGSFSVKAATNDVWSGTAQSVLINLRLVNVTGQIVASREINVLEGSGEASPVWERQATDTILTKQSVFNGSGDIAAGITATGNITVMRYSSDLVWKTADAISLTTPGTTTIAMNSSGNVIAIVDTGNISGNYYPVKVYKWNGSVWNQLGQSIYPLNNVAWSHSTAAGASYGGLVTGINAALNADGTRLIIGQPNYRDNNYTGAQAVNGIIRMYQFNSTSGAGGQWQQMGNSIIGVTSGVGDLWYAYDYPKDRVGTIVAINGNGDRIASYRMSTYKKSNSVGTSGTYTYTYPTLEVYDWNTTTGWALVGGVIVGEVPTDGFSSISLSSDGNRIAVGSVNNDDAGYNTGSTRVYEFIAGTWQKIGQDLDGEAYEDLSGISVSLNGDGTRVAISAPRNDDAGLNIGHTRVYQWDTSTNKWVKTGLDISWAPGTNDEYSHRNVDINYAGDAVIISGNGEAFTGTGSTNIVTNNRVYKLVSI